MDNGIYITLSHQIATFRDMDVTANNIANINTTGFNGEHTLFHSYVMKDINQGDRNPMALAYNPRTYRNTDEGGMKVTNNQLDVAISGSGYFQVETPLGIRYTRDGVFQIGADGTLVSDQGYPLLDNSGQHIVLPEDTVTVEIGSAGNMKVNGQDFSTIGVVDFANPQLMERLNGQLFKSDVPPQQATDYRVLQGTLENSNVQPIMELTHMISLSRSVDSTAKFIEVMYDLERKSANTWAQQG